MNDHGRDGAAGFDRLQMPRDAGLPPPAEATAGERVEVVEPELEPYDEIRYELDQLQNPRATWAKTIQILLFSAVLFFLLGLFRNPVIDLLLLMVVILVHEMGHFLGMRLFGYGNVRMFFIPLFGAAVSGRKVGVEGYQEAIVVLLGPLPGLVISFFLALAFGATQQPLFASTALWFLIINAFNLLPVFPLDGGRLLQITLFSRSRYLESLFQIIAGLALLGLAYLGNIWLFYPFGGLMLLTVRYRFQMTSLALDLNRELAELQLPPTDEIPRPLFRLLVERVHERLPQVTAPKTIASSVLQVWERMHFRPPGVLASLALLFVYAGALVATIVVPIVLMAIFGWGPAGQG